MLFLNNIISKASDLQFKFSFNTCRDVYLKRIWNIGISVIIIGISIIFFAYVNAVVHHCVFNTKIISAL